MKLGARTTILFFFLEYARELCIIALRKKDSTTPCDMAITKSSNRIDILWNNVVADNLYKITQNPGKMQDDMCFHIRKCTAM